MPSLALAALVLALAISLQGCGKPATTTTTTTTFTTTTLIVTTAKCEQGKLSCFQMAGYVGGLCSDILSDPASHCTTQLDWTGNIASNGIKTLAITLNDAGLWPVDYLPVHDWFLENAAALIEQNPYLASFQVVNDNQISFTCEGASRSWCQSWLQYVLAGLDEFSCQVPAGENDGFVSSAPLQPLCQRTRSTSFPVLSARTYTNIGYTDHKCERMYYKQAAYKANSVQGQCQEFGDGYPDVMVRWLKNTSVAFLCTTSDGSCLACPTSKTLGGASTCTDREIFSNPASFKFGLDYYIPPPPSPSNRSSVNGTGTNGSSTSQQVSPARYI